VETKVELQATSEVIKGNPIKHLSEPKEKVNN